MSLSNEKILYIKKVLSQYISYKLGQDFMDIHYNLDNKKIWIYLKYFLILREYRVNSK